MSLTPEDARRIAHLARLAVREEDIPGYAADLTSILTFIEQMESAETDDIEPMAHPQEAAQPLRDDLVTESDIRDRVQAIAPAVEAGLYLVPQVIE